MNALMDLLKQQDDAAATDEEREAVLRSELACRIVDRGMMRVVPAKLEKCRQCGGPRSVGRHGRTTRDKTRLCEACYRERLRAQWREAQWRARQRATARRQVAAGMLREVNGGLSPLVRTAGVGCRHCGGAFTPERTSARFCSPKCRVAAHRARAKAGG
jgi:hypothetical protein